MKKCITLMIVFLSLPITALAGKCVAEAWPEAHNLKKQEFVKLFKHIDRDKLDAYLFHELKDPQRGPLAYYLLTYLNFTENNKNKEGFYSLLDWAAEMQSEKTPPRKLEMAEICKYYDHANQAPVNP